MSLPVLIGTVGVGVLFLVLLTASLVRGSRTRPKRKQNTEAIVRSATRALSQNPKDPDALTALGEVYFTEQNWEQAATIYAKLADLVATNPELDESTILMRHGLASMQLNRFQDAYRSLVLASRDKGDVFEINFNLGQLELRRKNYERAALMLRRAYVTNPDHIPTSKFLGQAMFRVRRYSDAIEGLRRAVDADPADKESLFFLGQSYYEIGKLDYSGRIFRQLRVDPVYGPRAALIGGSIHLKSRVYREAEVAFQIGLKHENVPPDIVMELKYRLAATYTRTNEVEKALITLMEISRMNPAYKDVAQQIDRARELAGNKNLQIFLIGPTTEFVGLGRRIVNAYFPNSTTKITDINVYRSESADILAEVRTARWEDIVVFRFMRTSGQTGELVVRDMQSRMKDIHAGRGLCLTAGTFSEGAKEYVEARFIDLVEKDELLRVLQRS